MNLSFNELSLKPYLGNDHVLFQKFEHLISTFIQLKSEFGYDHIITPSELSSQLVNSEGKTFIQWFGELSTPEKNRIQPILFRRPFSDEALEENMNETMKYSFECEDPKIHLDYCKGLSTAILLDIPAISLTTHEIWTQEKISFTETNEEMTEETEVSVINICDSNLEGNKSFHDYSIDRMNIILETSNKDSNEKTISLRDDHGKDILLAFSKKIRKNPYVDSIVNSLPFNPNTSRFIFNQSHSGIIEIVLHWEDAGYGIVVQTTGKNIHETKMIAEILRNEYDK
ncbi:hypothetical protein [Christiangramia salexigens]|uniref:Uncharacterized protein n=1 Tax=Christiangramia salexigens TaxID=1913577 RepID=A0A1L3J1L5_9FLAO|nr:hypothetical protein [Christiangramia salexigens]APG59007.1 hypothetical protein LPB144_00690 [Christiangramia salexigens]